MAVQPLSPIEDLNERLDVIPAQWRPSRSGCGKSAASGLFCSSMRISNEAERAQAIDGWMNEQNDLLISCSSCGHGYWRGKRTDASWAGGAVLSVAFLRMAATVSWFLKVRP